MIDTSSRPTFPGLSDWIETVRRRHCKRAFLDHDVPRDLLEAILTSAAHAPSSRNMQPWGVEVLTGDARDGLSRKLLELFDSGVPGHPDFRNHPSEVHGVYADRAAATGAATLAVKGIDRDDSAARKQHIRENFRFFGAPVELILHLPQEWPHGGFLAIGCFLQNIMLSLVAAGLGSCPQYSVAGYSDAIREYLGLSDDRQIVCGLAIGYPDPDAPINAFVPERAELSEYCRFHDLDPTGTR